MKKKLAFSKANRQGIAARNLRRYICRKLAQEKRVKANPHQKWEARIESFIEDNSRVMPNKRDTVLVDGQRVAKRHLLCSKYEAYMKFKKIHPDYSNGFTTFKKNLPKNIRRLKMSNRRVGICLKDYNLEQKVRALNKVSKSTGAGVQKTLAELSRK